MQVPSLSHATSVSGLLMPSRYSSVLDALARILTCPEARPASHVNSIRLAVDKVTQAAQCSSQQCLVESLYFGRQSALYNTTVTAVALLLLCKCVRICITM
jgi:hypothetical protein